MWYKVRRLTLSPQIVLLAQVRIVKNSFLMFTQVGDSRITLKNFVSGTQLETSSRGTWKRSMVDLKR